MSESFKRRRCLRGFMLTTAAVLLFQVLPSPAEPLPEGSVAPREPLAIVVNRTNAVESLTSYELRQIFLGERSHWPNGHRITLVMRDPGEPERQTVLQQICHMTEADFSRHFLHGIFTGEVFVSPKTLSSSTGVRKFVFNVPGAIGYLRASEVDNSVKVIRVDEHLLQDKGYRLQVEVLPTK